MKDKNMTLPQPKTKKLIKSKEFAEAAKKVRESFEEEARFLREKKIKDGDYLSSSINHLS
ncbi:MAG: hypothetical protein M1450_01415 [Patescibacteria group bacterium]|nr:hypothetical protein [Patescibacteria group bacterium]